jgi:hypothetical protein
MIDLDAIGPGAIGAGGAPVPAAAWNGFAFRLGARLLAAWADTGPHAHVFETLKTGIAFVGAAEDLRLEPNAYTQVLVIEATLGPITLMAGGAGPARDAVDVLHRLFQWGTRRIRRDRRCPHDLAGLAAEAADVHGGLAELLGRDRDEAVAAELEAQREHAGRILCRLEDQG